jgi:hypothetical protein
MGMNIESLPDFDDMDKMAKISTAAKANLEDAKNNLNILIADCIQEAMENTDYWLGNKPPTMSYCEKVISISGNTPKDCEKLEYWRKEIIAHEKTYQESKLLLDNMKSRIAVWQTSSANGRKVNL